MSRARIKSGNGHGHGSSPSKHRSGRHRFQVRNRIRQGRTTQHADGTSTLTRDTVTIAEPVIPIVPWISGPVLYAFGLLLHAVWLTAFWERMFFVLVFAVAGAIIGRFAAEYGKARTHFQRRHAALTPPLFSVIISVPLVIGWGRISSLLVLTYWVTLSGGWVARVARSVWGDGSDPMGVDAVTMFGDALKLPGLQVSGAPLAIEAGPSAGGRRSITSGISRGLQAITGRRSAAGLPPASSRVSAEDFVAGASISPDGVPVGAQPGAGAGAGISAGAGAGAAVGAGGVFPDLPFDAADLDGDGRTDGHEELGGKVVVRRLTARGLQGFEDIAAQKDGLRNATRSYMVTVHRVPGNPQAADVRFVREDLLAIPTVMPGPSRPPGTSASEAVRVGIRQDGTYQMISLMETMIDPMNPRRRIPIGMQRIYIAGTSGAGKTSFTQAMLYELADRGDVVVWMSDVAKGGQTAAPAMGMIDWLTLTVDDTYEMIEAARRIVAARSMELGRLRIREWMPGCGLSLLLIVFEEAANFATANRKIKEALTRLTEQARSVGIALVLSMQRPSGGNLSTDARGQKSTSLCFGTRDEQTSKMALSASTLASGVKPHLINTTQPGWFVYEGSDVPAEDWSTPGRTFYVDLEALAQRVQAGARYRTTLDQTSVQAAGEPYVRRCGASNPPAGFLSWDEPQTLENTDGGNTLALVDPAPSSRVPRPRAEEDVLDAEIVEDSFRELDADAEYEEYAAEEKARAQRSPQQILEDILSEISDGTATTSWLVKRWTAETTRSRRELYRALDESPRIRRSGERGKWVVTAPR